MNFNYTIENYYPQEKRAFVVYKNADDVNSETHGAWVYIDEAMSQDEIRKAVMDSAPVIKWQSFVSNPNIEQLLNQENFGVWQPTPETFPSPESEVQLVGKRNKLLAETDWTQLPDVPLSDSKKIEWATYRQALRDLTAQEGWPTNITWPKKPAQ